MNYTIRLSGKIFFLILFGLYTFIYTLHVSLFEETIYKPLTVFICIGLLGLFFSQRRRTLKSIMGYTSFFVLFCIAAYVTDRNYLAVFAALVVCAPFSDFRSIVVTSLSMSMLAVGVIFMGVKMGTVEDRLYFNGTKIVHAYGFNYYSWIPFIFFYCIIMYMYLRKKRIRWIEIVIIGGINYMIFDAFHVRLTYYLMWIIILMEVGIVKFGILNLRKKWVNRIFRIAFCIGEVVSVLVIVLYDSGNSVWLSIDRIFSGRINLGQKAMELYPMQMFGNHILTQTGEVGDNRLGIGYFYLDSGFLYSLLGYGLLFTLIVILMYSYLYDYACISNDKMLFIWVTAVLIFTMVNNTWVDVTYNPVLLYVPIAMKEKYAGRMTKGLQ